MTVLASTTNLVIGYLRSEVEEGYDLTAGPQVRAWRPP
jgi:hypothetical protein